MLNRITGLVVGHGRAVLLGALLTGLLGAVVGAPIQRVLVPSRLDFSDPQSESARVEGEIAAAAHTAMPGSVIAMLTLHGSTAPGGAGLQRIKQVSEELAHEPGVASVFTPLSSGGDRLISPDHRYAGLVVTLRTQSSTAVQRTLGQLQARFAHQRDVRLGGTEFAYKEASDQAKRDIVKSELIAFPLLAIAALLIFRGLIAAMLPLLTGGFATALTLAAMRLVNGVVPLSNFALNLVTGLTLALAIDYSLFVISRFREGLESGLSVEQSVAGALATAGRTVIVSALTIAGMASALLLFPQRYLYSMAICGLLVAGIAALTAITLLPALLMVLGERVNARSFSGASRGRLSSSAAWARLAVWVTTRPRRAALLGAGVLIALALPTLGIRFVAFNSTMLPSGTGTREVADIIHTRFPQFGSIDTVLVTASGKQDHAVTGVLLKLTQLPDAVGSSLPQYLGHSLWLIELEDQAPEDSAGARALVRAARKLSTPGLPLQVGGVTATSLDKLVSLRSRLPAALAIIAIATLAFVFALTGSVVLPIKAFLINLLTIAAAFGLLVLVFQDGYLHSLLGFSTQPGLEATQPVLLFAIAFGLSTDYGIFLLARITEEYRRGRSTRQATVVGMQRTGSLISAAAVLFCIAIGALATSPLILVKLLGLGAAFSVILDATFARALLVPSLIVMLGRFNWWAPRSLRRLHSRLGLAFEGAPVEEPLVEPALKLPV